MAKTPIKLRTTPLADWHQAHGGKMAPFGDYLLPLWYTAGAKLEHLAVLQTAGLFDTSHMGVLLVEGPAAFELLQHTFSRDLARYGRRQIPLSQGAGIYGVFLHENGHLVDDAIIYRLAAHRFFICINAGKNAVVADHLQRQATDQNFSLTDLTGQTAKIDLQGPAAARILQKILRDPAQHLQTFPPFTCKGDLPAAQATPPVRTKAGGHLLLARSGYTGEFGFEIFLDAREALLVWQEIMAAGEEFHLLPCGLAARDSLRTGAVLPLAGHDIGNWPFANNPWEFALPPRQIDGTFSKPFPGSAALLHPASLPHTYPFAGFDPRKIEVATAEVFAQNGERAGIVLTCVTEMATDRLADTIVSTKSPNLPAAFVVRGLCCGFVKLEHKVPYGTRMTIKDQRRQITVEIVADIRPQRTARLPMQNFL